MRASFRVGTKVRFVRGVRPAWEPYIGCEGVVDAIPGPGPETLMGRVRSLLGGAGRWDCEVQFRHVTGYGFFGVCVPCMFSELEPLIDPRAEEFLESIKTMKPYEEPKVVPQKVQA